MAHTTMLVGTVRFDQQIATQVDAAVQLIAGIQTMGWHALLSGTALWLSV